MSSLRQPARSSTTDRSWTPARSAPLPAGGAVDVWRADLEDVADGVIELLSHDERARVARFARRGDGQLWGRAHGVLRALLGGYLDTNPRALRFTTEEHGKPRLSDARLFFNLSHSGSLSLFAFSRGGAIGVDVEVAPRQINETAVAARSFGPAEAQRLATLDPPTREREFLRLWVRHEAELKCVGTGIGHAGERTGQRPWIAELALGPDAAGAIAVEQAPRELRCWVLSPGASAFA